MIEASLVRGWSSTPSQLLFSCRRALVSHGGLRLALGCSGTPPDCPHHAAQAIVSSNVRRYCFPIRGRHRIPCHRGRLYPSFWGVLHPPRGGALYPFYQRDNLSLAWGCCVPPRGCRTPFCEGIFYPLGGIASLSTRGLCTPLDMGCTAPALGLGCCIPFLHGDVRGYFAQFPQGYGIPLAWGACCAPPQGPLGRLKRQHEQCHMHFTN